MQQEAHDEREEVREEWQEALKEHQDNVLVLRGAGVPEIEKMFIMQG